ncbi:MAG: type II toxin-antitoxin system VapC family toxin, partial [Tepidisphaeraceae bacterium]
MSEHRYCDEHAKTAGLTVAQHNFDSNGPNAAERFRSMFGPGHLDQSIRQAIGMCWMMLPQRCPKRPMTYLDSAILAKLFTQERDSEHWRNRVGGRRDLAISALAIVEVKNAFRRKIAQGALKPAFGRKIWNEFRRATELGAIRIYPVGSDVVEEAVRILDSIPRRVLLR